jgi:hypothetical protein
MCLCVCYQLEFHNLSFCKEVLFSVLFSNASVVRTSLQLFGIGSGHIKQFHLFSVLLKDTKCFGEKEFEKMEG